MADGKDSSGKASSPYKPGNIGPDGDYVVGKSRPPKHTQFAVGDGRRRGRRPKGQKNHATEFLEESRRMMTIRENGRERRVSKHLAMIIRAYELAISKGDTRAIQTILNELSRIGDKAEPSSRATGAEEEALLEGWIEQQLSARMAGDNPGDPETPPDADDGPPKPDQPDGGDD